MADTYSRDPSVQRIATGIFAIAIAGVGAVMMGVTSSPAVKGAALLWLPAALQLMAGVWLGPTRGFVAAAVGAQSAGIIAYGGWAPSDWIMNFVAGGLANALLPAVLFRLFAIDPEFSGAAKNARLNFAVLVLLGIGATVLAFAQRPIFGMLGLPSDGPLGYLLPILFVFLVPIFLGMKLNMSVVIAILITIFVCGISAAIGVTGAVVGGQTWTGAIAAVGVGWFFGDTVSALVGLYALASLTPWARDRGIAPLRDDRT